MAGTRLDVLLVERGYFTSREQAKRSIMAGEVFVNGTREDKAGTSFAEDRIKSIEVRGEKLPYVSRGGLKLEKALCIFEIDVTDCVCLDIGASTGGFTDCMLQAGAKKVYAVDVGYGQLAYKLQTDARVVSMERTNFRHLAADAIPEAIDLATADVAFISLDKILPAAAQFLKEGARMVCLIKPQFEAGRDKVGKKGVVRDEAVHIEVIERVIENAFENGFTVGGLDYSPVTGPEGNIEYLLFLHYRPEEEKEDAEYDTEQIRRITDAAWSHFERK